MAVQPNQMPADLTGSSQRNKVQNEVHEFSSNEDRIFVPTKGAFYVDSLVVNDSVSGRLLAPITDYKCLAMHEEGTRDSGQLVCCVISILNENITSAKIDYQAIGGNYENTTGTLAKLWEGINSKDTLKVAWGTNVYNKPDMFPAAPHRHKGEDFADWNKFTVALNNIYHALVNKDTASWQSVYNYIDRKISLTLGAIRGGDADSYNKVEVDNKIKALSDKFTSSIESNTSNITRLMSSLLSGGSEIQTRFQELSDKIDQKTQELTTKIEQVKQANTGIQLSNNQGNRLSLVAGKLYYNDGLRIVSKSSSYTLSTSSDLTGNTLIRFNTVNACTLTIPRVGSAMRVGDMVHVRRTTGEVTITANPGVTINQKISGIRIPLPRRQLTATLVYIGGDEWDLITDLEE